MTLDQFIAVAVVEARVSARITQKQLAMRAGIDEDDMSDFCQGKGRITWPNIKRVSAALNTTPGGLLSIAEIMYARAKGRRIVSSAEALHGSQQPGMEGGGLKRCDCLYGQYLAERKGI